VLDQLAHALLRNPGQIDPEPDKDPTVLPRHHLVHVRLIGGRRARLLLPDADDRVLVPLLQVRWTVNATVTYTLTTALIPPVESTLSLTCDATPRDGEIVTTVRNRTS
jgi:hypothetical protein